MEKLNVWSRSINTKIEEQQEKLYKSDFKFFKLDRLVKISVKVDEFSDECEECETIKGKIEDLVEKIPDLLNGSPRDRHHYEKQNDAYMKHLEKKHGIVQPTYFLAVFTLIGIIIGLAIGGGIAWLIHPGYISTGLMIGFSIGILAGRIYGKILDKKKKILGLVLE